MNVEIRIAVFVLGGISEEVEVVGQAEADSVEGELDAALEVDTQSNIAVGELAGIEVDPESEAEERTHPTVRVDRMEAPEEMLDQLQRELVAAVTQARAAVEQAASKAPTGLPSDFAPDRLVACALVRTPGRPPS